MKRLLITAALLAVTAPAAGAAGLDINWNQCLFNAGAHVGDKTFTCSESAPGAADANLQQFAFYGSVRTGTDIPGVLAWESHVDIQVAAATLDPWWDQVSGGCREGAHGYTYSGFPPAELGGCSGGLMDFQAVGVSNWIEGAPDPPTGAGGANRARFEMLVARTVGVTAVATVKYALFRAVIDSRYTVQDPNDPVNGDHACSGCLDPACLVLNQVDLETQPTQSSDGHHRFFSPEISNFIVWQGGGIGGGGCPAATPTRKITWGQVKSLYR